ncbi:NADP-dependent oxidoreductase [Cellulomonas sp. SLBN-39]|uniref:NADP-dependent oxidoreductase n=1 Tax=Cellulomonas sp. SLBN-39 TaxID=2768446 RepID=UPI00115120F1|nr:NADP-dependent oxidoreductase [Cellulomonas sp. SLBN-39]TQL03959.1 NADPH:quinone reductase-like Zn-dependent oxidoreductase [Cellulomonas sp. SLBN-39]
MQAYGITRYKQPLTLLDVPEPVVGPGDVLVDVGAAGLNHLDEKIRAGEFKAILPATMPLVLGHDVAGTVLRVGAQVTGFAPGDRVYARAATAGTLAERIAVAASDLAHVPASLTTAQAAGLPLVALTAWQALVERGGVGPGSTVLVHAGAGAVGSLAVQLAKHLGAHVAATASGAGVAHVRDLGADVVVDYRSQDFAAELSGYDLVLDTVGGDTLARSFGVLRPGGKVVGIVGPPDPAFARAAGLNPVLRLVITALSGGVRRKAARLGVGYEFLYMRASGEQLAAISALVESGTLRPLRVQEHAFDRAPEALAALAAGQVRGKAVVSRV